MAKVTKVEASIQTKGRYRNGDGKYIFILYDRKSNATIYESIIYSNRSNAKRGALRHCKSNNMEISLWVK